MKSHVAFLLALVLGTSDASPRQSTSPRGYSSSLRRCDGTPSVPIHRRACSLFLWDAPSALFYKWCHHLLKDHLIEGKGGHMYVRFESNSILQLLYPCSRYSPNKCLICGGSYPDHLELWWSKHLYTPFDRHLDETYHSALTLNSEQEAVTMKPTKAKGRNSKAPIIITTAPSFAFHKKYVEDVSDVITKEGNRTKQMQLIMEKYIRNKKQKLSGWTMQTFPRFQVGYILPPIEQQDDTDSGNNAKPCLVHGIVRSIVLGAFNNYIYLQETENAKLQGNR